MIRLLASFFTQICHRYLPSAFIFSIVLTFVVFFLGIATQGRSMIEMTQFWGNGVWKLLAFSMQMVLILISGNILANTKFIKNLLTRSASKISTPSSAIIVVTLISTIASWLNWGFGLIVGAVFAVELFKKVKGVSFPLLIASAYSGFIVWHGGLSGSIPLKLATAEGFMSQFLDGKIIPTQETIFSTFNISLSLFFLITLPIVNVLMHPHEPEFATISEDVDIQVNETIDTPAKKLEHGITLKILFSILLSVYLLNHFYHGGDLNLNVTVAIFLLFATVFSKNLAELQTNFDRATQSSSGIILQFPLYAGIMGMMSDSGLANALCDFFVNIASDKTLPLYTYLSAGLVNFFVPSGGGQWAVQGPIMIKAANQLGVSIPKVSMALAWGDAWSNMLQPFWALPLLSIAKLNLQQIMGYCVVVFLWVGLTTSLFLFIF